MNNSQIKAAMKKWGVPVVYRSGWETRGRPGAFNPQGIMIHHTGSNSQSESYLKFLFDTGRSDLSAPLCHVATTNDGKVVIGSNKRSNHGGKGSSAILNKVKKQLVSLKGEEKPGKDDTDGNTNFYGNEVMFDGSKPMTDKQYNAAVRWAAAICDLHKWSAQRIVGHGEWTKRKWDPGATDMDKFRRDVAALLKAGPGVTPLPKSTVLGRGDKGPAVTSLQKALMAAGYDLGKYGADGDFGPATEKAVIAFQTAAKIGVDGLVGDETLKALAAREPVITAPKPVAFWVALANIQSDHYSNSPAWDPRDQDVAKKLSSLKCSAYAVNEVTHAKHSAAITKGLGKNFRHDGSPRRVGNDLWVDGNKFKIKNSWTVKIAGIAQDRSMEVIEVEHSGVVFNFVLTHLPNGSAKQRQTAANFIVNHLKNYKDPIILLGDFNNEKSYTLPYKSPRYIFAKAGFIASRAQAKNITNGEVNELHSQKSGQGKWLSDAFTRGCKITDVRLEKTSARLTDHHWFVFRIEVFK